MQLPRLLILLLALSLVTRSFAQPSADEVLATAYKQASSENKNIIVIFHASWCGWCHKMSASINDPQIKHFFDASFVVAHLTVLESPGKKNLENKGAEDSLNKWGGNNQGIPYWVVFNSNGALLADSRMKTADGKGLQNTGCPASSPEVDYFISVLKKTTRLNDEALTQIKTRFRKNEQ